MKLYFYKINIILLFFIFCAITQFKTVKIINYNKSQYVYINELTHKFKIEQTFDIITQKGKLFYKGHYAIYNLNYSVMIIDNKIIKNSKDVIRKKGEVLIPVFFAKEIIESFFPDLIIKKHPKFLSYNFKENEHKNKSISERESNKKVEIFSQNNADKINFIVIDPGHGGKDPGAISSNKVKEKVITLQISKYLESSLKKRLPGIKIILTRQHDVFIELSERTDRANRLLQKGKNGLFVSVHVNASISKKISGFETYFLSQNPTNEEARNTAALENNVVLFEDNKNSIKYQDLDYIEATMKTTQILKESSILGNDIQKSILIGNKTFKSRGVRKADFFVLRGVMMPAVLVEVGFITNIKEVRFLLQKTYQKKMAKGISEGIIKFVKQYNSGKTLMTTN